MILEYVFNDEDFEYETDIVSFLEDIKTQDLVEAAKYICKYFLSDEEFLEYEKKYPEVINSNFESGGNDILTCAREILETSDTDYIYEALDDKILDYYKNDAKEAYEAEKDSEDYFRDPYKYYGLKRSDF